MKSPVTCANSSMQPKPSSLTPTFGSSLKLAQLDSPTSGGLSLDLPVCLFTLRVSLLTGLLFGVAPVFRASHPDLSRILNACGRGNVRCGARALFRKFLVAAERALALRSLSR